MNIARAERSALSRVCKALERAEAELPQLAAPDGTVALQIDDLRAVITQMDRMRDTLALSRKEWIERWYGSEPQRGSSICTVGKHGGHGETIAYLGGDEETHKLAQKLVSIHNSMLATVPIAPELAMLADIEQLRAHHGSVLICPDDEEATHRDKQTAVDCVGDWTNWEERRFYGATIPECLAKAAEAQGAWTKANPI
jgi:hypothetical protein